MNNPVNFSPFDGRGIANMPSSKLSALQKSLVFAFAIILLSGLGCFLRGSPLIDPLPTIWIIEGFTIGGFIGLVVVCTMPSYPKRSPYFLIPLLCGLALAADVQAAVEAYAFWDFAPQRSQIVGPIIGPWLGRGGGRVGGSCDGIRVDPFPGSRVVGIRTDSNVCSSVKWSKSSNKGCFLIDVETGRRGIRRVYTPINSYFSEDSLRPCST